MFNVTNVLQFVEPYSALEWNLSDFFEHGSSYLLYFFIFITYKQAIITFMLRTSLKGLCRCDTTVY